MIFKKKSLQGQWHYSGAPTNSLQKASVKKEDILRDPAYGN